MSAISVRAAAIEHVRSGCPSRLAFLSPYVVDAMLGGRLKLGVVATSLVKPGVIPLGCAKQAKQFIAAGE